MGSCSFCLNFKVAKDCCWCQLQWQHCLLNSSVHRNPCRCLPWARGLHELTHKCANPSPPLNWQCQCHVPLMEGQWLWPCLWRMVHVLIWRSSPLTWNLEEEWAHPQTRRAWMPSHHPHNSLHNFPIYTIPEPACISSRAMRFLWCKRKQQANGRFCECQLTDMYSWARILQTRFQWPNLW